MKLSLLFFFIVMNCSTGYYLNKNLYMGWSSNSETIHLTFGTKGYEFGSQLLIISHNQKFIGFYSTTENFKLISYRFNPRNSTIPSSEKNQNEDALLLRIEDHNFHFLPRIPHYLQMDVFLNTSILKKTFNLNNGSVNVFMAYNGFKSLNSTKFEQKAMETFDLFTSNSFIELEASFRLEFFHESTVAVSIFILFILTIFCFLFSGKQPLKARGASSYGSLFILLIHNLFLLTLYFDLQFQYKTCYLLVMFLYPTNAMLGFIYGNYITRIMIFQYINKRKIWFIEKKNDDSKRIAKLIRLFRFIVHPLTSAFLFIFVYLFIVIILLIPIAANEFQCSDYAVSIAYTLSNVFTGLNFITFLLWFLFDILVNIGLIIKCRIKKIFKQDAYSLKLEFYIFSFIIFSWFVLISAIVIFSVDNYYIQSTIISLCYYTFIVLFAVFPLIKTIYMMIFSCISRVKFENVIEKLYEDESLKEAFYEFAKGEWSTENVECYSKIRNYKKEKKNTKRKEIIELILKDHLLDISPLEVNLSNVAKSNFKKQFKEQSESEEYSDDLFDDVNKVLIGQI
jgi:hypothetical protein